MSVPTQRAFKFKDSGIETFHAYKKLTPAITSDPYVEMIRLGNSHLIELVADTFLDQFLLFE